MSSLRDNKLQGKIAIVTGGASGVGEVTAHRLADHGCAMVVIADIQDELGRQVADSIGPQRCTFVHCDVSDEKQVKDMVESTVHKYGKLDIMFSNAAILSRKDQTVLDLDMSDFEHLFGVNVRGMVSCVKHAARVMVEGRVRGSIVCTTSLGANMGMEKYTDYCMSKHAVLGLVRSASMQLGVHGIRVNCVSPNAVPTPMTCKSLGMEVGVVEKVSQMFSYLKGVVPKAGQVADAVVFLASEDSEFVTGHNLVVDGGYVRPSTYDQCIQVADLS